MVCVEAKSLASPGTAPALDRALDILELLSGSAGGLTLSEVSQRLAVPKNSVFRITQTLLARGYLVRDAKSLAFRLTPRLLRLAQPGSGTSSLPELSREVMKELRDATRETVQLGVLSGFEGIIIDQVEGPEPLRIVVDLGLRFALHDNAPGKLLLASLPPDQQAAALDQIKLTPTTMRTITSKSLLRRELRQIRSNGFATDFGEANEGIHCVAAPICQANGEAVAAIWVSGPAKRMPKNQFHKLGLTVKAAGQAVTQLIGEQM